MLFSPEDMTEISNENTARAKWACKWVMVKMEESTYLWKALRVCCKFESLQVMFTLQLNARVKSPLYS